jgi:multimeric flavodoxin WrbA
MKVLGLVGSGRKLGNSEILCLTDYRIKPCQGCAACLFQGVNCVIEDDGTFDIDKMADSDGIILGVPCYILEATDVVKQLIDRGFAPTQQNKVRGKVRGVIVPYATRG